MKGANLCQALLLQQPSRRLVSSLSTATRIFSSPSDLFTNNATINFHVSSSPSALLSKNTAIYFHVSSSQHLSLCSCPSCLKPNTASSFPCSRLFNTGNSFKDDKHYQYDSFQYEPAEDVEVIDEWEEEEEADPEIGDGGDGGGVALRGVSWGEKALSLAQEVLVQFGDDMKLFSFKTSPRGYIYVRLDKLSNEYGCPSIEELESFSQAYKSRLDEAGAARELPDDLALEVSSPGAERLLKIPDDLYRFKDMPMGVSYVEEMNSRSAEKNAVFMMESIDTEAEHCIWKLADVRENRDPESKGRPLNRKQKDQRIKLPFAAHKRITLYLD